MSAIRARDYYLTKPSLLCGEELHQFEVSSTTIIPYFSRYLTIVVKDIRSSSCSSQINDAIAVDKCVMMDDEYLSFVDYIL